MPERLPSPFLCLPGILLSLFLLLVPPASAEQAPSSLFMHVSTTASQGYTIKVQTIREDGGLLVDLASLSRALRLRTLFDGERMQIDEAFSASGSSCLLTPGGNFAFVVPSTQGGDRRVLQLTAPPMLRQGRLFLPVSQACRLFSLWLDRDVTFESPGRLRASFAPRRSGDASRSIGILVPDEGVEPEGGASPQVPDQGAARPSSGPTVIEDVRVETMANGCVVRFIAAGGESVTSYLRPDENGNAYLTIEKATGNLSALTRRYRDGVVRSITPVQLPGGALQFTVALNTGSMLLKSSSFQYDRKSNGYMLYVMSDVDVTALHRTEKERQIQQQLSKDVSKWQLDAIVIDAGHGGKDSGAIGTRGTREKDVALNIAIDLGKFIKQRWPGVKVIYTRKDDYFIPLNERGRIANRFGGKLFISIHCNSTPTVTKAHGAEVYILGLHKTQAALDVAMFENSVISREENYRENYQGMTDEHLIMSSMAQSAFATQSTELAQDVVRKLDRYRNESRLGVRQAGFMVLWTPSMPSILVETGYLSNPDEEKILRDREQQTKIAFGIFQGLQQYRSSYENHMMASGARLD